MKKLLMALVLLPLMVLAYETWTDPSSGIEWRYTIQEDGAIALYGDYYEGGAVSDVIGELIIPLKIDSKFVTSIGDYAFFGCDGLTSVAIPPSVTYIGKSAFSGCTRLTSVKMPSSVTRIGAFAFLGCDKLTSVTMPISAGNLNDLFPNAKITVVEVCDGSTVIDSYVFSGCDRLMSVTIPSSVTRIEDEAFSTCSELMSINVKDGNAVYSSLDGVLYNKTQTKLLKCPCGVFGAFTIPSSVTSIGTYAFSHCSELESVTIPQGVTSIEAYAFSGCSGLGEMSIPPSVMRIGNDAFSYCSGLEAVAISPNVTRVGFRVFAGCSGLKTVIIPEGVTSIERSAFSWCYGLTSVTIPSSVTRIEDEAFCACRGLESVTVPPSVTYLGNGVFRGCSGLQDMTLPFVGSRRGNADTCESVFQYVFGKAPWEQYGETTSEHFGYYYNMPSSLKSVVITDETKIGSHAFAGCRGLTSVVLPESVTSIEDSAFYGCSGLADENGFVVVNGTWHDYYGKDSSVMIPPGVVRIGDFAFGDCWELVSVTIPEGVTSIGERAFSRCIRLSSVTIPASVTNIGCEAFSSCDNLKSVSIAGAATVVGRDAFRNCSGLADSNGFIIVKNVLFNYTGEDPVVAIPSSVTRIGDFAFNNCKEVVSVTIPSSVTSIGEGAFSYCSSLTSVTIPPSVTSIGHGAFEGTPFYDNYPDGVMVLGGVLYKNKGKSPLSLKIPASVTSIGEGAFADCRDLTSVTIPSSVTSIGEGAFSYCSSLTSVTIPPSVTSIGGGAFYGCSGLVSIAVDANNSFYGSLSGLLYNKMKSELICCPCGKAGPVTIPSGVTSIGDEAFSGCSGLTSVTIPSSVTSIGDEAFSGCSGLTSVAITGRFNLGDVFGKRSVLGSPEKIQNVMILAGEEVVRKNMFENMFASFPPLSVSVVISEGITTLDECSFFMTEGLKELTIPSTVTSVGDDALKYCSSLKTIHVSNDGDIEALKQLLYESGFDVNSVTFDHVEEPVYVYYKVAFDAQGGVAKWTQAEVREGMQVGGLPTIERDGYEFLGWFTSTVGGTQVTAETVVTRDVTFYAHWKRIGSTADEEIISGKKITIETGLKGYKASGLPSGLKYDAKTGKITGAAKTATAAEGVVVKFTKKNAEDEEITIAVRAEDVSVGCEGLSSGPLPAGVVGASEGIDLQIYSEGGTKSVSVSKLPTGMKYDSKKGVITGAPSKAGNYEVTLTVTTKFGTKETVKIPVSVAAMPAMASGTFSGFVSVDEDNLGTFKLTASSAGKLTAKVVTAAGTYSFSKTGWDSVAEGVYSAKLKSSKGDVLTLMLDSTAAWNEDQLSGSLTTAAVAQTKKTAAEPSRTYDVSAQRHAFGKTWYFTAAGDATVGWTLSYASSASAAKLTVSLKADGSTALAGTLPGLKDSKGKALKISASGYANVGGLKDGAILADFAPVLTVNKVKTVLAIKTNLWFDRSNDHEGGVGEARFVK